MRYKFKPGDKVKVVKRINFNSDGHMDKYFEKIVTISEQIYRNDYRIKEDNGDWCWSEDCFELANQEITLREFLERREAILNKYGRNGGDCNNVSCTECCFNSIKTGMSCDIVLRPEPSNYGIAIELIKQAERLLDKEEKQQSNQLEIKYLEKQARDIADRLAKLKENIQN